MFDFENIPVNETTEVSETSAVSEVPEVPEVPEAPEAPEVPEAPEAPQAPKAAVDLDYILKQISGIQADTARLKDTLDKIALMNCGEETKICAMKDLVMARETTNQQLLDFYTALYNDHKRPFVDTEWVENTARKAGKAAKEATQAAKETAKDWGGKMKDWFKDRSKEAEGWTISFGDSDAKARPGKSLKEKVLDALRSPCLDEEDREVILECMTKLKTMSPEMRDQALDILTDPNLDTEDKTLLLENLSAIDQLDD